MIKLTVGAPEVSRSRNFHRRGAAGSRKQKEAITASFDANTSVQRDDGYSMHCQRNIEIYFKLMDYGGPVIRQLAVAATDSGFKSALVYISRSLRTTG